MMVNEITPVPKRRTIKPDINSEDQVIRSTRGQLTSSSDSLSARFVRISCCFGGVIDRIKAVPRRKADVIRACGAHVPRLAICDHFDHPIAEFRETSMSGGYLLIVPIVTIGTAMGLPL